MESMEGRFSELENKVNGIAEQFGRLIEFVKAKETRRSSEEDPEIPHGFTPQKNNDAETSNSRTELGSKKKNEDGDQKLDILENRLRATEGGTLLGSFNVDDLCSSVTGTELAGTPLCLLGRPLH